MKYIISKKQTILLMILHWKQTNRNSMSICLNQGTMSLDQNKKIANSYIAYIILHQTENMQFTLINYDLK